MTVTSTYDELFAVLADERLRTVVSELDAAEGTLSVSQLADRAPRRRVHGRFRSTPSRYSFTTITSRDWPTSGSSPSTRR